MSTGPLSKESRAALRRVTSQMVADYLTARGWEWQWERIWDPNCDYEQRMGDCIRSIATAEGRDHISVLSDILGEPVPRTTSDTVWVLVQEGPYNEDNEVIGVAASAEQVAIVGAYAETRSHRWDIAIEIAVNGLPTGRTLRFPGGLQPRAPEAK